MNWIGDVETLILVSGNTIKNGLPSKQADFGAIFNTKIAIFAGNIALLKNFLETVLFSGRSGI